MAASRLCVDMVGGGDGYVDTLLKASSGLCRSSAISERILAIARGLGSVQSHP